jgi:hypothetical protein
MAEADFGRSFCGCVIAPDFEPAGLLIFFFAGKKAARELRGRDG